MDWLKLYEDSTEQYNEAKKRWPISKGASPPGKWILASYDNESIIVYQAFCEKIADFACKNGFFIGCPDYNEQRMTWIKTNFLWMMYRSSWGTSSAQTRILAIWLRRSAFDRYLSRAVHSTQKGVPKETNTDGLIRLQWDPDHHPNGTPITGRRAIQLGLKRIQSFIDGRDIIRIVDISDFVQRQHQSMNVSEDHYDQLRVPIERIYEPEDEQIRQHINLDSWQPEEDQ